MDEGETRPAFQEHNECFGCFLVLSPERCCSQEYRESGLDKQSLFPCLLGWTVGGPEGAN